MIWFDPASCTSSFLLSQRTLLKFIKKAVFIFFLDYPQQNHSRVLHSITAVFPSARTEWVDKQELNSSCIDRINALFIGNAFSTFNYLASAPLIESNAASSNPYVFWNWNIFGYESTFSPHVSSNPHTETADLFETAFQGVSFFGSDGLGEFV